MEILFHALELLALGYLVVKAHRAKSHDLRDLITSALLERVQGGGRERLRASIAKIRARREQRQANRVAS